MKDLYIILFVLLCGVPLCTSCQEHDSEILDRVNMYLEDSLTGKLDSVKFIIIIPEQGCGTCITQAENFYNEFSQRNDILFIFCNVLSNKILKHKIDINYKNTILDYNNEFLSLLPQNKRIYPCVFAIQDRRASALIWQSVKQSAFMAVRKSINN